eukprot:CAMPEP_0206047384 /NCGR_PEP_ID=MMETSP1466-20131121/21119_1 /ASSEMBLY_ACC=CAM_ASM_001126 /TAXON_ID=44452 /ORGANISM="Pavlova gyrans, Strain CCMP608" /LENGTH=1266 /DNA_ID=CAMNT_0053422397 /DNA_START=31 /DNA_END=3827 /DNA_ORIENTATION=+
MGVEQEAPAPSPRPAAPALGATRSPSVSGKPPTAAGLGTSRRGSLTDQAAQKARELMVQAGVIDTDDGVEETDVANFRSLVRKGRTPKPGGPAGAGAPDGAPLQYGRTVTRQGSFLLQASAGRRGRGLASVARRGRMVNSLFTSQTELLSSDEMSPFEYTFQQELKGADMTREDFDSAVTAQSEADAANIQRNAAQLSISERITLGAYFLDDAVARRSTCKVRWNRPACVFLYRVHRHRAWFFTMAVTSLVLCILAVWEPQQSWDQLAAWEPMVAEAALAFVLVLDVAMPAVYLGPTNFARSRLARLKVAVTALVVVDLAVAAANLAAGVPSFRASRVFRPVFIFLSQKSARHSIYAILSTLPAFSDVLLLMLITITIFAIAFMSIFGGQTPEWPTAEGDFGDTYSTFWSSWLALFTLITTENFPNAMLVTLDNPGALESLEIRSSGQGAAIAFDWVWNSVLFAGFSVLTSYMILSVFVAVIFENYKLHHKRVVIEGKRRERRALLAAFSMVDTDGDSLLSLSEFYRLMKRFRRKTSTQEARVIHKLLDTDSTGDISLHEFLNVCDILVLRPRERVGTSAVRTRAYCSPVPAFTRLVSSATFALFIYVAILVNAVFVVLRLVQGDAGWLAVETYQVVDRVFLGVFFAEMALKLMGLGLANYARDGWNRFDASLVVLGIASEAVEVALRQQLGADGAANSSLGDYMVLRIARVLRLVRVMRTLRVVTTSSKLRALIRTFLNMLPMFFSILWVILIVMYVWAIAGIEVLHRSGALGSAADYGDYPPAFDTLIRSFWTLTIVLVGNDWSDIMLAAMSAQWRLHVAEGSLARAEAQSTFAALYFVVYFLLVNMILVNLLMALVIEVYAVEVEKSMDAVRDRGEELIDVLKQAQAYDDEDQGKQGGDGAHSSSGVKVAQQIFSVMTQSVRATFREFDVDGDGLVPVDQCGELLDSLGSPLEGAALQAVVERLDMDQSGFIEFREFLDWWQAHGLRQAFAAFDRDGSGEMDAAELSDMLLRLGIVLSEADVQAALAQMDKAGDGKISFGELSRWWNRFDIMSVFAVYDTDASGRIGFNELAGVVRDLGLRANRRDLKRAMELLDADHDAGISLDEFFPLWELMSAGHRPRADRERGMEPQWEDNVFLRETTGWEANALQEKLGVELLKLEAEVSAGPGALSRHAPRIAADVLKAIKAERSGLQQQEDVEREYRQLVEQVQNAIEEGRDVQATIHDAFSGASPERRRSAAARSTAALTINPRSSRTTLSNVRS